MFICERENRLYYQCEHNELIKMEGSTVETDEYTYYIDFYNNEYNKFNTYSFPIIYHYENNNCSVKLSNCRKLEYFSLTLVKLMCSYRKSDFCDKINDKLIIDDIIIKFHGHRYYTVQQNPQYEKYDPCISLEYSTEKTPDEIYKYVRAIDDFLRLIFFENKVDKPTVKLCDNNNYYLSFYVDKKDEYCEYCDLIFSDHYVDIIANIPDLLRYVFKNEIDSSYFERYYEMKNLQKLFIDTYIVFDKLSSRYYAKKQDICDEYEKFKKKIWEKIEREEGYEKVEAFIGNLKDKIMSHGLVYGHKEKLKIAYQDILNYIPRHAELYYMNSEDIVERIYDLRTDIVHKGAVIKFSNFDLDCLEKLQWITYIILLREIGIPDDKLDDWLDYTMGVG